MQNCAYPIDLEIYRSRRLSCARPRADDLPSAATLRRLHRKFKVGHSKRIRGLFSSTIEIGLNQIRPGIGPSRAYRDTWPCAPLRRAASLAMSGEGIKRVSSTREDFRPLNLVGYVYSRSSLTGHHSSHRSNFNESHSP